MNETQESRARKTAKQVQTMHKKRVTKGSEARLIDERRRRPQEAAAGREHLAMPLASKMPKLD
jgi:hypothetical protein